MEIEKRTTGVFGRSLILLVFCIGGYDAWAQTESFAYAWNTSDFVLVPGSLGAYAASLCLKDSADVTLSLDEIRSLDRTDVNGIDRFATYTRNTAMGSVGDVLSAALPIIPLTLLVPQIVDRQWENAAVYGLMYLEVYFLTTGITNTTKFLCKRTRPFYYNTDFTPEERYAMQGDEAPEGKTSFFSGHSSRAFAAAVFLSKTFTDIYGDSTMSRIVWGVSLSAAALCASSRVADGEHFPTDVAVGAVVGSAIGYLVPELHRMKTEDVSISVAPNSVFVTLGF